MPEAYTAVLNSVFHPAFLCLKALELELNQIWGLPRSKARNVAAHPRCAAGARNGRVIMLMMLAAYNIETSIFTTWSMPKLSSKNGPSNPHTCSAPAAAAESEASGWVVRTMQHITWTSAFGQSWSGYLGSAPNYNITPTVFSAPFEICKCRRPIMQS